MLSQNGDSPQFFNQNSSPNLPMNINDVDKYKEIISNQEKMIQLLQDKLNDAENPTK